MKRRTFLVGTGMSVSLMALPGCDKNKHLQDEVFDDDQSEPLSDQMSSDEVMTILDLKAAQYMQRTGNCAQSTFLALSDVFGLNGKVDIRALTVLPGIAERGETCGCVVASMMAIGLTFGSSLPGDREAYDKSLAPANRFYDNFMKAVGKSSCSSILEDKFGHKLDLKLPEDLREYRANQGPEYCATIVRKAVKLAATEMLKKQH